MIESHPAFEGAFCRFFCFLSPGTDTLHLTSACAGHLHQRQEKGTSRMRVSLSEDGHLMHSPRGAPLPCLFPRLAEIRHGKAGVSSHPRQSPSPQRSFLQHQKKKTQTQVKTTEHPPHGEGLDVVPVSPAVSALNNTPRCIFSPDSYWNELMHSFSLPASLCLAIFPNNL